MKPAVVACIQRLNGEILLLNRNSEPVGWCLAGGKIEENETPAEAIIREVMEETGIDISHYDIKLMGESASHNGRHVTIFYVKINELYCYLKISDEHKGHMWMKGDTIGIELAGKTLDFMRIALGE